MAVATQNRFLLLDENEDPQAVVASSVKKAAAPAAAKPAAAPAAAPAQKTQAPAKTGAQGERGPRPAGGRGGNNNNRGPRPPRPATADGGESNAELTERPDRSNRTGPRDGDHQGHSYRGARNGPGHRPRGGRAFDRQSGTGIRDSEKRQTVGKGNWGKAGEEVSAEGTKTPEEGAEKEVAEGETAVEADKAEAEKAPKEVDEDEKFKTYDQYLAEKAAKAKATAAIAARKANEGSDDAAWKNTQALARPDEEVYFVGKTEATPAQKKAAAAKPTKQQVDIVQRFADSESSRGSRGGRGGARGGSSRGGARGGRPSSGPKATLSEADFPALGK